jgi:hypothetical protein
MYHSGLIGNIGLLEVLGTLTAGQFNKMLPISGIEFLVLILLVSLPK